MTYIVLGLVLVLAIIIYIILQTTSPPNTIADVKFNFTPKTAQAGCDEIVQAQKSENIKVMKEALVLADNLVDYTLQSKGFLGDTVLERAENAKESLGKDYNKFLKVHEKKQGLVSQDNKNTKIKDLQKALFEYEQILDDLGINPKG